MSYVPSPKTKLVYALMSKRISEDQFFKEFQTTKENISSAILDLMNRGLAEKDPDPIESAIPLMYRYGVSNRYLEQLNILALEPWHFRHEDIVFSLGKLKDPSSIPILEQTALAKHAYLENDEFNALGTKSVHALENIQTQEAIEAVGRLGRTGNEVVRSRAVERLKNIRMEGETESAKAAAASLLINLDESD